MRRNNTEESHAARFLPVFDSRKRKIRGLIRPDDDQYVWRQIRWHTDFWTVRQKAAAQDKPILVFWLDGAGYRDPLGLC